MIKTFIVFIVIFLLAGCTPSINKNTVEYYTLHSNTFGNGSVHSTEKPIYDFVKIDLPHISTRHTTKSIVYSEKPFKKNSYLKSEWKDPLPILLQEWLVQSINEMNLFKGVIRVSSRANVPLMLETDIVQFEHLSYKDEVNVAIRIILLQYDNRKILRQKLFSYRKKVTNPSAHDAVVSFNTVLNQFNEDLFLWLKS